jgi:hypothetical protein
MKRTTICFFVLLMSMGLFSSAKQRNATCDKLCAATTKEKCSKPKPVEQKDAGFGLSPLTFFMTDF